MYPYAEALKDRADAILAQLVVNGEKLEAIEAQLTEIAARLVNIEAGCAGGDGGDDDDDD